jgi:putative RNA 2'-phosphotransferase
MSFGHCDAGDATGRLKGMEHQELVRISKAVAKTLRHKPERLGLSLEAGGWVDVEALLSAFHAKGFRVTRAELEEVVAKNDKQRFSFDETGTRIRANQGHSVEVDLQLEPREPPEILYHGTTTAALTSILETGLQRMKRHHVHLSPDTQTAHRVGSRHGKAVILRVKALEMQREGHTFYCSENGVWLVDEVPHTYLEVVS